MSGNPESAKKAAETMRQKYGADYFSKTGKKGGTAEHKLPGGFGSDKIGTDGLTGKERAKVVRLKPKEEG